MSQFNQLDAVSCTSSDRNIHRHTKPASARATLIPVPHKQIHCLQIKPKVFQNFILKSTKQEVLYVRFFPGVRSTRFPLSLFVYHTFDIWGV